MIRLFRWLVFGDSHIHDWETIKEIGVRDIHTNTEWTRYILQCTHCGNIKIVNSNEEQ